jgi:hypothetical protein
MRTSQNRKFIIITLGVFIVWSGCRMQEPPHTASAMLTDPCAERLHDLAGALLLFYSRYGRLPKQLEDLSPTGNAAKTTPLKCPVSNLPYLYASDGIPLSGYKDRLIVWDAQPCHNRNRWVILDIGAVNNKTLILRVILWPESSFTKFTENSVH